jgi:hypothetical protein
MPSSMSNYPNGFSDGLLIRNFPASQPEAGKVFWVSNATTLMTGQRGGSNGNKGTFDSPFSTLAYALTQCVANRGDYIYIKPGHAESVTSATALPFSVAGVTIVGLGSGSKRPTFTFTTANTATIPVSADNITVRGILFVGNFLSIASTFTLTTAADFWIDGCEFRDTSAILGFLSIVTTTVSVNSDGLTYTNNRRKSDATTSPGPDIVVANTMSRLTVNYNKSIHTVASNNVAALLEHGALVMTDAEVVGNFVYSVNTDTATGAILVKTTATTGSGFIAHNRVRALDVAAAIVVPAAAVQYGLFDNLYVGDGTSVSGFVLPAIGSDA